MAIPDYQALMRRILSQHAGGGERSRRAVREALAEEFQLTQEDLPELLPSGTQATFQNR